MKAGFNVTSSFLEPESFDNDEIIFSEARRLESTGSICDTYLVNINQRRYFVKRLKPEFRDKPLYLAALKKEFEIGVSLHHQSIPRYYKSGPNYIITDYVEGSTLAELLESRSPWLSEIHNVKKLIKELLDVIGYLHSKNIVHCDIKADNIIITSSTRNVVLVDFDKCHTSVHSTTSGNPMLYGLEKGEKGSRDIDFHALGILIRKIEEKSKTKWYVKTRLNRFVKACLRKDVNIDELYAVLRRKYFSLPLVVAIVIFALGAAVFGLWRSEKIPEAHYNIAKRGEMKKMPQSAKIPTGEGDTGLIFADGKELSQAEPKESGLAKATLTNYSNDHSEVSKYEEEIRQHFVETAKIADQDLGNEEMLEGFPKEALEKMTKRHEDNLSNSYRITRMFLLEKFPEIREDEVDSIIESSPYFQMTKRLVEGAVAQNRRLLEKKKPVSDLSN